MKKTIQYSLTACAAVMTLGLGLTGCSNGSKVDFTHMSKSQQLQAAGQMDDRTRAAEQRMGASIAAMQHPTSAKPGPPAVPPVPSSP